MKALEDAVLIAPFRVSVTKANWKQEQQKLDSTTDQLCCYTLESEYKLVEFFMLWSWRHLASGNGGWRREQGRSGMPHFTRVKEVMLEVRLMESLVENRINTSHGRRREGKIGKSDHLIVTRGSPSDLENPNATGVASKQKSRKGSLEET
jgi:hypothetical protein